MRRKVFRNIEQIKTKNRPIHGVYRCRVMVNGKNYELYETSFTRAKNWVLGLKNSNTNLS